MKLNEKAARMLATALMVSLIIPQSAIAAPWTQDITTGNWYHTDNTGKHTIGWFQDTDGKWYYFRDDGVMLKNTWHQNPDGKWYFLSESGAMLTNTWYHSADEKWYYLNATGDMLVNSWHQDPDQRWYYVGISGAMLTATVTPDGYTLKADGSWDTSVPKKEVSTAVRSSKGGGGGGGGSHSSSSSSSSGSNSSGSGNGNGTISGGGTSGDNTKPNPPVENPDKPTIPEEKPDKPDISTPSDAKEYYDYMICYKDVKSGTVLSQVTGRAEKGSVIEIEEIEIEGYDLCTGQQTEMTLSSNNMTVTIYYEAYSIATPSEATVNWEVRFTDEETHSKTLAPSRSGKIVEGGTLTINFMPRIINGTEIWESLEEPPVEIDVYGPGKQLYYIEYEMTGKLEEKDDPEQAQKDKLAEWYDVARTYESALTGEDENSIPDSRFLVTNQKNNDSRLISIIGQIDDTDEHTIYMIGKDFAPNGKVIPSQYDGVVYSNLTEERITFGGSTYSIVRMSITRKYEEQDCVHRWKLVKERDALCLARGRQIWECEKCGEEKETYTAALGHIDENGDSICDRCNQRTEVQKVGDTISATLELDNGTVKDLTYTCIDADYQGGMLYLSNEAIDLTEFGGYGSLDYNNSNVQHFFAFGYGNASSIGSDVLMQISRTDGASKDYAILLSEDEADTYKDVIPKTSNFLARVPRSETLKGYDTNGTKTEVTDPDASGYGIRPAILLPKPNESDAEAVHWNIGDMQAREIDGVVYMFKCIDQNYVDGTQNHRKAALFLCDSIIAANTGSTYVYEEQADGNYGYTYKPGPIVDFGNSNDYKYSNIHKWLSEKADTYNMEPISIGVDYAYMGATETGRYSDLDDDALSSYYIGTQKLTSNMFSLSVDEALKYKEYLWNFTDDQYGAFSKAYWLRTPMGANRNFKETNQVYVVDIVNGNIHPQNIKPATDATDDELKSTTTVGVRPAFCMPQM